MRIAAARLAALLFSAPAAHATVLTVDQSAPSTPTVTRAQVATSYGVGIEGFTPNVQVGLADERLDADFAGLGTALTGADLVIGFLADEGFETTLFGFEVAADGGSGFVIPLIRFENAVSDVLFGLTDYEVPDASGLIDLVELTGGPLTARVINVCIMLSELGDRADDIGFDDVTFGQQAVGEVVPLPGVLVFVATGLGLAALRRC